MGWKCHQLHCFHLESSVSFVHAPSIINVSIHFFQLAMSHTSLDHCVWGSATVPAATDSTTSSSSAATTTPEAPQQSLYHELAEQILLVCGWYAYGPSSQVFSSLSLLRRRALRQMLLCLKIIYRGFGYSPDHGGAYS